MVARRLNQNIEPFQAVYHTKTAVKAAKMVVEDNTLTLSAMIDNMGGVRFISTLAIREIDLELRTFFAVNTPLDLKLAEGLLSSRA